MPYIICRRAWKSFCTWRIDARSWRYSSTSWLGEWMEVNRASFFMWHPMGCHQKIISNKKKMSMLRQQAWMDDDEFDYIVKNWQRVLELSVQYEDYPYVEEFTKQCNVMFVYGTYALKGRQIQNFLWVIYRIYFKNIFHQTTNFTGKW